MPAYPVVRRATQWLDRLGPVRTTFLASLLLSWIAYQGHLLNRDGIYYLDFARTIVEAGFGISTQVGELFFLPLLIATFSSITPFGLEVTAKVLNACLLAGTCALLVDFVRKRAPSVAWLTVLVVLAMPAYNQYRNEILREPGFWFFALLGFWFATRWTDSRQWRDLLLCQLAILAAALFRLEAMVFFFALAAWQLLWAQKGTRLRSALMICALPIGLFFMVSLPLAIGVVQLPSRVALYMAATDPFEKARFFSEVAARMSETVFPYKYSKEEAVYILLFGLLSVIPVKFLKMMGVLIMPFAYRFKDGGIRAILAPWQPLPWAFAAYLLVLAAFVTHQMFLVGRYVSMLNLLVVPLVAIGLANLIQSYPRWKMVAIALGVVTIFANVVSTAPQATQVLAASQWLKTNVDDKLHVGMENNRFAYYAGWKLSRATFGDREYLAEKLASHDLDWAVLEVGRKDRNIDNWLASRHLLELRRFDGTKGEAVVIVAPIPR